MKSDKSDDKIKLTIDDIMEFCKKNVKYISAGILLVALVIVIAVTASKQKVSEVQDSNIQGADSQGEQDAGIAEFKVDAIPELNKLVSDYYDAYAAGDLEAIEANATPVSEMEKGYVKLLSQYVTGYKNIVCYTKDGQEEGSYAVSVSLDMHFDGIETMAPGLDFFYIRTNEDGELYIDNLYSQFNLQNKEEALDSSMEEFIASYEGEKDVVELRTSVEKNYNKVVEADEDLKTMVNTTIPGAMKEWLASLNKTEEPAETTPEEPAEAAPAEPAETTPEAPVEEKPAETASVSEKVYATDNINIRKEPNETAEKVGNAAKGDSFTRTGISEAGWSTIEYHGANAYVKSEYLSTEAVAADTSTSSNTGITYVPEGKVLTMNSAVNIRRSMDEASEKMGTTQAGDTVKVILSYQEGWTKVEWNQKIGYIKTELLINN